MKDKINVAELLKDCPKGMELDCTTHDKCILDSILEGELYPVKIRTPEGALLLTKYGSLSYSKHAKCVIFPKGKTTWEGFQTPFKDGDIAISESGDWIGIVNSLFSGNDCYEVYVVFENFGKCSIIHKDAQVTLSRLATEEEKQKLFQAIKDNGYKWNTETKTLESLVVPKFKVGDMIKMKVGTETIEFKSEKLTIVEIKSDRYIVEEVSGEFGRLPFVAQDYWELVPDKFDITALEKSVKPKFKVGDRIIHKSTKLYCTLGEYSEGISAYRTNIGLSLTHKDLEDWELAPNKFDITTLKPFKSKVLVRAANNQFWRPAIWGVKHRDWDFCCVVGGEMWEQCIPYEGNEHLLGTTNDCNEYYKIWE